ncbi:MAG: TonB-dependent receptor [Comamonadaceae bacterium]|nr:MAG: TonB-dependent receptor [Comamonadaceae bacterium]
MSSRFAAPKPLRFSGDARLPALRAVACCALLACAAGGAAAQALSTVTVSATRTERPPFDVPASVDVIDGERLRGDGRAQLNLSESLALVPGLLARDRQNQAQDLQLSVRGFGARSTFGVRGVRIYVDGIPATMPDGQGQLSHVDIGSVERVEVLRGPFSALYGNSSGGVVQIFTQQGEGPATVTPSVAFGSDGFFRGGLKAMGRTGADPSSAMAGRAGMGYTLDVTRITTDGSRAHSAAERELANARLDWSFDNGGHLMLVANHLNATADDPLGLDRAQFNANPTSAAAVATQFNTRKTVRQTQVGAVYDYAIGGGNSLRAMAYQGQRATRQYQAIPVAPQNSPTHPGGVIDLDRDYGGIDLRFTSQASLASRPLEVVAGVAYDEMREQRRGFQNFTGPAAAPTLGVEGALRRNETNRVSNLDPYAQATWQLAPQWALNAGVRRSTVRFDSADQYITGGNGVNGDDSGNARYSATLPAIGLMFSPSPQLRYYVAAGKGFETPTFNELAYRPGGLTGLNFALKPSRSDNLEAGVKGRGTAGESARVDWSAAVFQTGTEDEIVTATNVGGRSTFQNAGSTRRRGLELASSVALPGSWLGQVSYTWLDARYRDAFQGVAAGNRIPGIAKSSLAAELGWRPALGWRGGVEARYLSSVPVNDANTDSAASFFTAAAHIGYVVEKAGWRLSGSARVENLFDKAYAGSVIVNEGNGRYFEPAAGRSLLLSLTGSYAF